MNLLNKKRPVKILQFGEGNFLRAFVDYMIDIANEKEYFNGDIVIVKAIEFGSLEKFKKQDCNYTVSLRGIVDNTPQIINRQITCIEDALDTYSEYDDFMDLAKLDSLEFVVSNTTESGIQLDENDSFDAAPPKTFPGKLTKFLYERFKFFNGDKNKGLIMLPVELIDDNGIHLKECVLKFSDIWNLGNDFIEWIEDSCTFCSTLVDRIVTGYPGDTIEETWESIGYKDELVVAGEPFALWVIESPKDISNLLPLDKAGLPVIFTHDQKPYKQRKVRILNGAHTSFVLASFHAGNDTVLESMNDELIYQFMHRTIFNEIIPTLSLPEEELSAFAEAVITRFKNPYIKHALLSISLNSVSKWKTRCMPSLTSYYKNKGEVPKLLAFSLAALFYFYMGEKIENGSLIGTRNSKPYNITDDEEILKFFMEKSDLSNKEYAYAIMSNSDFWGEDLTLINNFTNIISGYLDSIDASGMRETIRTLLENK